MSIRRVTPSVGGIIWGLGVEDSAGGGLNVELILKKLGELTIDGIDDAASRLEDPRHTTDLARFSLFADQLAFISTLRRPLTTGRSLVREAGMAFPNSLSTVFDGFGRSRVLMAEQLAIGSETSAALDVASDLRRIRGLVDFGMRTVSHHRIDLRDDAALHFERQNGESFERFKKAARATLDLRREANSAGRVEERARLLYYIYLGSLWWRHLVVARAIFDSPENGGSSGLPDQVTPEMSDGATDTLNVPVPVERRLELDPTSLAAADTALEPLLHAAQVILDSSQLDAADEAELRSLATATHAELTNPRMDVVGLERLVGRLAAFVAKHTDVSPLVDEVAKATQLDPSEAADVVRAVQEAVVSNQIGDPNELADIDHAARLLASPHELLADAVQAAVTNAINDPAGLLATRLTAIDQRLSARGSQWTKPIAQNLAAAAFVGILGAMGALGIAFRAVVWILIAIYKVV